jgi:RNA polymerase sigma factor (sigma-70 family)
MIEHLRRALLQDGAGPTDAQLLASFVEHRDEAAFAAIVKRHGRLVWNVCRRILGLHDTEDAFQATFLVLCRKAASIRRREMLASWLYGVAYQTALQARRTAARRRAREKQVADMPEPAIEKDLWNDLQPLLDQELSRLPEGYRVVLLLCDLEGKPRKEAARQLGLPQGTIASRLARARAMLANRLGRHGLAVSGGALAGLLPHQAASAAVPTSVVSATIKAATVFAASQAAATGVISVKVAALMEGVVRTMFLAKLKTVICTLALTLLVGLGAAAVVPGSGELPAAGAATAPHERGDTTPDAEARKLVRQLGSSSFRERQAAEKALADMGGRAAASVRAGIGDVDPEIARRCTALWPRLWQTEMARPDADRFTHPLWARFKKLAGDDPSSRTLFAEMVADLPRFTRLEAAEADPGKASTLYAAELKLRVETLKRGYQKAEEGAQGNTGDIEVSRLGIVWPGSVPTRGEFAALLFLGSYPSTAAVTYPEADPHDRFSHHNVFGLGLQPEDRPTTKVIPPALRRLFVAWLGTRTDNPDQHCMYVALALHIAEVLPLARRKAADAALGPAARGFALLAVGHFGASADRPLVEKAFADSRVFFTDKSAGGKERLEALVSDTAVAAALRLAGQHPADFGFTLLERHKLRGPDILLKYHLLGFFDDGARRAAHKRAKAWLDQHDENPAVKALTANGVDWMAFYDPKTVLLTDAFAKAIRELPSGAKEAAIKRLDEALRFEHVEIRRRAALTLGSLGNKSGVPTMIEDLFKATGSDRDNVVVALRVLKDKRATLALRKALKDSSPYVRGIAVAALGEVKAAKAYDDIVALTRDKGKANEKSGSLNCVRILPADMACYALGALGDQRAVPVLIERLADKELRQSARQALEALTSQKFGDDWEKWRSWWKEKDR